MAFKHQVLLTTKVCLNFSIVFFPIKLYFIEFDLLLSKVCYPLEDDFIFNDQIILFITIYLASHFIQLVKKS